MLFDPPWPTPDVQRGFVMRDQGRVVGFLGTILSTRRIGDHHRPFCHLSSWIVRESHRSAGFELVLPLLAMKHYTLVNLSPSPAAHEIFSGLGFEELEREQRLIPLFTPPGALLRTSRVRIVLGATKVIPLLAGEERRIAVDMAGTQAALALLQWRKHHCLVIATSSSWRNGMRLATVEYASDWDLAHEWTPRVAEAFRRSLGTVGLRMAGRHARGILQPFAVSRPLERSALYRPSDSLVRPQDVDGLYSERVQQLP
ncbi:MAG: hypothetical protein ABIU54_07555 [Candidatus Eisenbacteria bacterium]